MPVSVVVGGQYGSEGKGKIALELVRRDSSIRNVVRPGGTNSGHTAYRENGKRLVVRQLPAAAIDRNVRVVLPAGSYIDIALLKRELNELQLPPSHLAIDPRAHVITGEHIQWEKSALLSQHIGSTASGTGAAVLSRLARTAPSFPGATLASQVPELLPYLQETSELLHIALSAGERVLIEGTQGFGLSPLHGNSWPKATGRDTTAAAFLSEAGISPLHVDEVVLVIRSYEIRVAGNSGPLASEITWEEIASLRGVYVQPEETSVTKRVRRVGHFDSEIVKRAILANSPTKIALNHVDYVDAGVIDKVVLTAKARAFVNSVEDAIGSKIDYVGTGPATTVFVRGEAHDRAA